MEREIIFISFATVKPKRLYVYTNVQYLCISPPIQFRIGS